MNEYHTLSENALNELLLFFEDLIELESNAEGSWEVDYSVGATLISYKVKQWRRRTACGIRPL